MLLHYPPRKGQQEKGTAEIAVQLLCVHAACCPEE